MKEYGEAEKAYYRELAGQCTQCKNFDYENVHYQQECYECKRYYGDMFEKKEATNDQQ